MCRPESPGRVQFNHKKPTMKNNQTEGNRQIVSLPVKLEKSQLAQVKGGWRWTRKGRRTGYW
jgi:hypothetical protein